MPHFILKMLFFRLFFESGSNQVSHLTLTSLLLYSHLFYTCYVRYVKENDSFDKRLSRNLCWLFPGGVIWFVLQTRVFPVHEVRFNFTVKNPLHEVLRTCFGITLLVHNGLLFPFYKGQDQPLWARCQTDASLMKFLTNVSFNGFGFCQQKTDLCTQMTRISKANVFSTELSEAE